MTPGSSIIASPGVGLRGAVVRVPAEFAVGRDRRRYVTASPYLAEPALPDRWWEEPAGPRTALPLVIRSAGGESKGDGPDSTAVASRTNGLHQAYRICPTSVFLLGEALPHPSLAVLSD